MPLKCTLEQRIEKFWSRADKSGGEDACWNWTAYRDPDGYGRMRWEGRCAKANRIAYALAYGEFPNELKVLHSCDNPSCVNPKHLFLGTQVDNIHDMIRKGRKASVAGENAPRRKLSQAQVDDIRRLYALGGVFQYELAERYGINKRNIGKIVRGELWKT